MTRNPCLFFAVGARGGRAPAAKKTRHAPAAKKKTRPPAGRPTPHWIPPTPSPGRARNWGVGRPAGGAFCVLLRVRSAFLLFAAGARQVYSLTCCPPPPSIHCRKKSRVRGVFFFAADVRAHSLTRCLPPGAPTAKNTRSKKKTRRAPAAKKHPQQKM